MQLTKEYFDKKLDDKLKGLATKDDVEDLARITQEGFSDVIERLDVRERTAVLEKKVKKIEKALHINL